MRFSTDNKWDKVSLNKVCEFISRGISPAYTEEDGVTVINQKCIRDNRINLELARLTNPNKKKITEQKYLKEFDILVNSTGVGTLGRVAQVKKLEVPMTVDSHVTIVRPNTNISAEFLGYNLFMQQRNIEHLAKGSTGQTELSRIDLGEKIEILLPPLEVQKAIANIFASLDEKIELNNQMNKTLEEMAQALFKRWFVDFEFPNENGEPYKSSGGEMVDSELGMIPKEWKVENLNSIVNIKYGKNLPTNKLTDKGYPVFGGNGIIGYYTEYLYKEPQVLVACRGAASGKVCYTLPNSFVTNNSLVLENDGQKVNYEYVKQYCLERQFKEYTTGSAQPQITIANLANVQMLVPHANVMETYANTIRELDLMKLNIYYENESLIEVKNTLLPKLMSGEIRVTDLQN